MMNKKPFPALYDQIIDLLEPYQAYLVGGAVRELYLGNWLLIGLAARFMFLILNGKLPV